MKCLPHELSSVCNNTFNLQFCCKMKSALALNNAVNFTTSVLDLDYCQEAIIHEQNEFVSDFDVSVPHLACLTLTAPLFL